MDETTSGSVVGAASEDLFFPRISGSRQIARTSARETWRDVGPDANDRARRERGREFTNLPGGPDEESETIAPSKG
jgi:hypothetical protein